MAYTVLRLSSVTRNETVLTARTADRPVTDAAAAAPDDDDDDDDDDNCASNDLFRQSITHFITRLQNHQVEFRVEFRVTQLSTR